MTDAQPRPDTGFPASVAVQTPDRLVPIGRLRAGDLVRSTDVTTGESGFWPVLETHRLGASRLQWFNWFDGESEGWCLAGRSQRFWVPTQELHDEEFQPHRDPSTAWVPADGPRSSWGAPRGWVDTDDLYFGNQWIAATEVPVALGWGADTWCFKTDRPRVLWAADSRDADVGTEVTFDTSGAIVALKGSRIQAYDPIGLTESFLSPTCHLTVERGHAFHIQDVGLLAADFVNAGGPLMAVPALAA